ncbi:MAG TPA: hypothetical protein VFR87_06740 [Nocardioidaceae bacterium]|nr:hypothetical protein [Nocardioidaceae bacterium]
MLLEHTPPATVPFVRAEVRRPATPADAVPTDATTDSAGSTRSP